MNRSLRAGLVGSLLATSAVLLTGCTDDFVSGPQKFNGSVQLRNWADTLVMGDRRMVAARVLDEQSREVLDRTLDWTVVNPSLLNLSVSTTGDGDSVRLTALLPGRTTVGVHFLDAMFEEENQSQAINVVLAGVQLLNSPAVTLTAAGDSAIISATALAHDSAGVNVAAAGQGLTWTHRGSAVSLTGGGDVIRVFALQDGVDTLLVTHPLCLAGATCADTVVVTVAIPVDPIAGPTPGADLLVFNDINMWDGQYGSGPENLVLFGNIVGFTTGGARASGHTVMFYTGAGSWCGVECSTATSGYTASLGGRLVELGYAVVNEAGSLAAIPADVKVIFIFIPMTTVPVGDVNGLKQFAGQGGRVVVVGENGGLMGLTGLAAENQLLQDLGAQLTNQGGCLVNGGEYAQAEGTHQLVTGLTQVLMACASPMTPGPDDFVLFRAPTGEVVGAVAKIDLTPLPI